MIIDTNAGITTFGHDKLLSLDELQSAVDGSIECVPLYDIMPPNHSYERQFVMIVNEEGKLMGLEANSLATAVADMHSNLFGDTIVGNAVIAVADSNGDFRSLNDIEEGILLAVIEQLSDMNEQYPDA